MYKYHSKKIVQCYSPLRIPGSHPLVQLVASHRLLRLRVPTGLFGHTRRSSHGSCSKPVDTEQTLEDWEDYIYYIYSFHSKMTCVHLSPSVNK